MAKNPGLFALEAQPSQDQAEKKKQGDKVPNHDTADVVGREDLAKISVRSGEKGPECEKAETNRDIRRNRGARLLTIKPGDPVTVGSYDQKSGQGTQTTKDLAKRDP